MTKGVHIKKLMAMYLIVICAFTLSFSYKERESVITIVDIGHLDRVGIAKELSIVNRYAPRVVGLDILFTTDSLSKDNLLSEELGKTKSMVQASALHNELRFQISHWDSLEVCLPKFRFGDHGFSNMTISDDSVIERELPMRQYYRNEIEFAFSYAVATLYDFNGINSMYKSGANFFSFDKNVFGHYFKVISVNDLMTGKFDKSDITGKIVLLGAMDYKEDSYYTDDNRIDRLCGVEFQACIIRAILD